MVRPNRQEWAAILRKEVMPYGYFPNFNFDDCFCNADGFSDEKKVAHSPAQGKLLF